MVLVVRVRTRRAPFGPQPQQGRVPRLLRVRHHVMRTQHCQPHKQPPTHDLGAAFLRHWQSHERRPVHLQTITKNNFVCRHFPDALLFPFFLIFPDKSLQRRCEGDSLQSELRQGILCWGESCRRAIFKLGSIIFFLRRVGVGVVHVHQRPRVGVVQRTGEKARPHGCREQIDAPFQPIRAVLDYVFTFRMMFNVLVQLVDVKAYVPLRVIRRRKLPYIYGQVVVRSGPMMNV